MRLLIKHCLNQLKINDFRNCPKSDNSKVCEVKFKSTLMFQK